MKKQIMTAMMTSISEVMETMFFMPIEFGAETTFSESGIGKKEPISCQLTFTGDIPGRLRLVAPKKIVAEMAENLMGESQDQLTDEHIWGTLTEMLNMVCGHALSKTNASVPFELGIPEIIDVSIVPEKDVFIIIETLGSKMAICLEIN